MSARDHIHSELMRLDVPTSIAWPLSCRSDADRLALARALVPECAVVPVEPSADVLIALAKVRYESPRTIYGAMLTAAKETQA